MLLASQQGLVSGYGGGLFGPNDPVNRGQMTTMLWHYAGSPGVEGTSDYSDEAAVASYAAAAVEWSANNSMVCPVSGGTFASKSTATRAQVADALMSFDRSRNSEPASDNLLLIQGGIFTMGSPSDEPERSLDEVQHRVTVDSFYMSPAELTQREYQAVMGSNPSGTKGDNLPVANITWYDAIEYCNRLAGLLFGGETI